MLTRSFHQLLDWPQLDKRLKRPYIKALIRLSRLSGLYPECLVLRGVKRTGNCAVAGGGFGEVWKGAIKQHAIAIKALRVYGKTQVQKLLKVRYHFLCLEGWTVNLIAAAYRSFRMKLWYGDNCFTRTWCRSMVCGTGMTTMMQGSASFLLGWSMAQSWIIWKKILTLIAFPWWAMRLCRYNNNV